MNGSRLAPLVLDGWYVLHQFFRIAEAEDQNRDALARQLSDWFSSRADLGREGWSGLYRIVGGGADVMAIHFRRDLKALGEAESGLDRDLQGGLRCTGDYVSTVELGLYALTAALLEQARDEGVRAGTEAWDERVSEALAQERTKAHVRDRLHPRQAPNMPYVCFYPMDKRRGPGQNWYRLPLEERARLMGDHGAVGRRYAGRVSQIISGSVGLDDWEWAVTLFAGDPLEFKSLITDMRYDEVSAVYAEFGSFVVGHRIDGNAIIRELTPPNA